MMRLLRRALLIVATCVALSGCSTMFHAASPTPGVRVVEWRISPTLTECHAVLPHTVEGCAFWNGPRCTIYTRPRLSEELLGHEVRHCFEGAFHP